MAWKPEGEPIFKNDIKTICRRHNLTAQGLIDKIKIEILGFTEE